MSGAQGREQSLKGASAWPLEKWGAFVPSLSDLAFLLPSLVLFWCTSGAGWLLTDSDTGWHIRTGEWDLDEWPRPDH